MKEKRDIVVVGGGFFGCALAACCAELGKKVLLCEEKKDLLTRASYNNQARIHNGYHYPRSILTALRSRVNFPRFISDFPECVDSSFEHYYAVPKMASKVSARQFRLFMERIEAPIRSAPEKVRGWFSRDRIEDVFQVTEYGFNAVRLKELIQARMEQAGVELWSSSLVKSVTGDSGGGTKPKERMCVTVEKPGQTCEVEARWVFNCTYSHLNRLLDDSGLSRLRLKHEITEMALVEQPGELRNKAVTVMCGPFFSTMPFPSLQRHTLSHVRYTPHTSWQEGPDSDYRKADDILENYGRESRFEHMRHDAARYLPLLNECRQTGSLWEVKTVLPQSEVDDSRPILFKETEDMPGLVNVMGGKIDNIYDVYDELKILLNGE